MNMNWKDASGYLVIGLLVFVLGVYFQMNPVLSESLTSKTVVSPWLRGILIIGGLIMVGRGISEGREENSD